MQFRVRRWPAVVAACAFVVAGCLTPGAASGVASVPGAARVKTDGRAAVLDWSRYATQAVVAGRPPASSMVLLGIAHVAIADTVAGLGQGRPFLVRLHPDRRASAEAAVATAAYEVLRARIPAQQQFLDTTYAGYLAAVPDGDAKQRGIRLGRTVAGAVLGWRAGDGFENTVPYVQSPPGPGVWEPTAPTPPADIVLTQVRPLVLHSADRFRPAGPDRLTSKRYAAEVAEVAALGRKDSTVRTARQTETAMFWSDNGGRQWGETLGKLAERRHLSTGETARLLSLVFVSSGDALIGCWRAKFSYRSWRPVHAIQRGDTDGNPATGADPSWQSLLNVNHPEYPSGHACLTGAATRAVQEFFHTDRVPLEFTSVATGTTRTYPRLSTLRAEVGDARVLAGLHFRHSIEDGGILGARTAEWVAGHFHAAP